jgi:hypothetical protein
VRLRRTARRGSAVMGWSKFGVGGSALHWWWLTDTPTEGNCGRFSPTMTGGSGKDWARSGPYGSTYCSSDWVIRIIFLSNFIKFFTSIARVRMSSARFLALFASARAWRMSVRTSSGSTPLKWKFVTGYSYFFVICSNTPSVFAKYHYNFVTY